MTFMHFINLLMLLATIAAVVVFFAIQVSPSLRTAGTGPQRPLPGY